MTGSEQNEQRMLEQLRQQLDASASKLDADTLRALRLARGRAIESLPRPRHFWQPVGAAALLATVAIIAVSLQLRVQEAAIPTQHMEDLQLLSASEELDLYEQLEFYQWLELEARAPRG